MLESWLKARSCGGRPTRSWMSTGAEAVDIASRVDFFESARPYPIHRRTSLIFSLRRPLTPKRLVSPLYLGVPDL